MQARHADAADCDTRTRISPQSGHWPPPVCDHGGTMPFTRLIRDQLPHVLIGVDNEPQVHAIHGRILPRKLHLSLKIIRLDVRARTLHRIQ